MVVKYSVPLHVQIARIVLEKGHRLSDESGRERDFWASIGCGILMPTKGKKRFWQKRKHNFLGYFSTVQDNATEVVFYKPNGVNDLEECIKLMEEISKRLNIDIEIKNIDREVSPRKGYYAY